MPDRGLRTELRSLRCRLGLHRLAGRPHADPLAPAQPVDRCCRCGLLVPLDRPTPDPRFFRGLAWGLAYSGCFWAGMTLLVWWLA